MLEGITSVNFIFIKKFFILYLYVECHQSTPDTAELVRIALLLHYERQL